MTRSAILHEDRAAVEVHVHFEQFHVLGCIHSDVRCNEIQTSSATPPPNQLNGGRFLVAKTYFLLKRLPTWPANVPRSNYCCMMHSPEDNSLPLSEGTIGVTSGKVRSFYLHRCCQVGLLCRAGTLLSKTISCPLQK